VAAIPAVVVFGDSLIQGTGYLISLTSTAFARWTSQTLPVTYPIDVQVDDIRVTTVRMPYTETSVYAIGAVAAATVTTSYTVVAADIGRWIRIDGNATADEQIRQISGGTGTTTITVSAAFSPALTASTGNVHIIDDSFTISAIGASGLNTQFSKTSGSGTDFTAADVGKWVVAISGLSATHARRIISVVDADNIVVDGVWLATVATGDGLAVMRGANAVHSYAGMNTSSVTIEPLRFYLDSAAFYTNPLYYPNHVTFPLATPQQHALNQSINGMPELAWRMRAHFDSPVHVIVLGIGGSKLTSYPIGSAGSVFGYSWGGDVTQYDYSPGSEAGLYRILTKLIDLTAQGLSSGDSLDIRAVCLALGSNDSTDMVRGEQCGAAMATLRRSLRYYIADNKYSSLGASQIPWVLTKVGSHTSFIASDTINVAYQELADDDPFTGLVEVSDIPLSVDGIHWSPEGSVLWGELAYSKWREIVDSQVDSAPYAEDRLTLSEIRTKVRRRYERTGQANDARDAQIDGFVNDALREFYSSCGDSPWFLELRDTIASWALYPSTFQLPRHIRRPLWFELAGYPGVELPWRGLGFTNAGQLIVAVYGGMTGQLTCVHSTVPGDLQNDSDLCVVPRDYLELVVLLTCKRLAEASGNATIAAYYNGESARVWAYVRRSLQTHRRYQQAQLTTYDAYDAFGNGSSTPHLWGL